MRIAAIGAGAVGGYYGAMLARAGHDVILIARGAHLEAIRAHGLTVKAARGAFTVRLRAESRTDAVGPVDLALIATKTYDNATAMPLVRPLVGAGTVVLTLQNGVDSPHEAAAVAGEEHVLGGAAYIATAVSGPGTIEQTGGHHRIVFGEAFGHRGTVTPRVGAVRDLLVDAGIEVEAAADAWVPLWEKYVYLAPFAGITGAARLPIGPLWQRASTRELFLQACAEVEAVARAENVQVAPDLPTRILRYVDALPPATRSSLLIDLSLGKPIEVEALQGGVVRRAARHGISVPVMSTLYAVLREHAGTSSR